MSSDNNGGNFFGSLNSKTLGGKGNFFENVFQDAINYQLQLATGGTIGYGNGGLKTGATTDTVVGGVKELTGAAAAEKANALARQQFEDQKNAALTARQENIANVARDQLRQSDLAGAARSASRTYSPNSGSTASGSNLGAAERDYLGL